MKTQRHGVGHGRAGREPQKGEPSGSPEAPGEEEVSEGSSGPM